MSRIVLPYKRKQQGKTDYKKRLNLLKSGKLRFVVRKSIKNILLQIVSYEPDGDKILMSVHSSSLKKYGWDFHRGNIPSAYLTGLLCGKLAKEKDLEEANLDLGLVKSVKGSVQYAAVKGAKDSGMIIPCSEEILPNQERIEGKSISEEVNKKFLEAKSKIVGGKNEGQ
ncbi:MAG: 50S ribosomal protein L18 [Nanoarchaeota archaeon]|nr:50S ribosomal protein L18 [Nanoarchaeota archaeon]|tara:strand:- start:20 stop:526 length:507 start_codon:yes stop_codon:yes gene_type:complete